MSSHFVVTNKGDAAIHVHAMSKDASGRFTHAYAIVVEGGHSKSFSAQVATSFMVVEDRVAVPGVLLPRGVPPADVEKPHDVPVDPAASAEAVQVADVETPETAA